MPVAGQVGVAFEDAEAAAVVGDQDLEVVAEGDVVA